MEEAEEQEELIKDRQPLNKVMYYASTPLRAHGGVCLGLHTPLMRILIPHIPARHLVRVYGRGARMACAHPPVGSQLISDAFARKYGIPQPDAKPLHA